MTFEINDRVAGTEGPGVIVMPTPTEDAFYVRLDDGRMVIADPTTLRPLEPSPSRGDWIDFLRYLAEVYDASAVVDVVEKPHKHGDWYQEYLALGGVER